MEQARQTLLVNPAGVLSGFGVQPTPQFCTRFQWQVKEWASQGGGAAMEILLLRRPASRFVSAGLWYAKDQSILECQFGISQQDLFSFTVAVDGKGLLMFGFQV